MIQNTEKLLVLAKNKKGETFSIPTKQRALVLQGGGALGVYEIGVLQSICNHYHNNIHQEEKSNDDNNTRSGERQQLFDIIAGVSIGAINAVFLIDYALKNNGNWRNSASKLKEFWNNFKAYTFAELNPWFEATWNNYRILNRGLATAEAARRYWSFYQLACLTPPFGGISPNLCTSIYQADTKYFSQLNNFLTYDYRPLMKLMEENISYPIKTDFEKNQPRLLLLSVDVKDCSTSVTFDSYRSYKSKCDVCDKQLEENRLLAKHMIEHIKDLGNENNDIDKNTIVKSIPTNSDSFNSDTNHDKDTSTDDQIWISIYGDENGENRKHVVSYNGIDNDILMTSCLFPYSNHHTSLYDLITKEKRTFWDGAFVSNTPLRELLQKHKDFWTSYFEANEIEYDKTGEHDIEYYQNQKNERSSQTSIPKIPDLEVFIVNLYPALETQDVAIPEDKDKIEDRINDIRFHDKSIYDEKIAHLVTDYVDLTRRLIKLAKDTGKVSKDDLNEVLGIPGESTTRDVKKRRNLSSLIENKFKVKVFRIDRQDDENTVFGKASDFTPTTLEDLYQSGLKDANEWFTNFYKV